MKLKILLTLLLIISNNVNAAPYYTDYSGSTGFQVKELNKSTFRINAAQDDASGLGYRNIFKRQLRKDNMTVVNFIEGDPDRPVKIGHIFTDTKPEYELGVNKNPFVGSYDAEGPLPSKSFGEEGVVFLNKTEGYESLKSGLHNTEATQLQFVNGEWVEVNGNSEARVTGTSRGEVIVPDLLDPDEGTTAVSATCGPGNNLCIFPGDTCGYSNPPNVYACFCNGVFWNCTKQK